MADQCVGVGTREGEPKPLRHWSFPQRLNHKLWADLGATRNKPKSRQAGKEKPQGCLGPLSDMRNAERK